MIRLYDCAFICANLTQFYEKNKAKITIGTISQHIQYIYIYLVTESER